MVVPGVLRARCEDDEDAINKIVLQTPGFAKVIWGKKKKLVAVALTTIQKSMIVPLLLRSNLACLNISLSRNENP